MFCLRNSDQGRANAAAAKAVAAAQLADVTAVEAQVLPVEAAAGTSRPPVAVVPDKENLIVQFIPQRREKYTFTIRPCYTVSRAFLSGGLGF